MGKLQATYCSSYVKYKSITVSNSTVIMFSNHVERLRLQNGDRLNSILVRKRNNFFLKG